MPAAERVPRARTQGIGAFPWPSIPAMSVSFREYEWTSRCGHGAVSSEEEDRRGLISDVGVAGYRPLAKPSKTAAPPQSSPYY
jgi:hypothetical protein